MGGSEFTRHALVLCLCLGMAGADVAPSREEAARDSLWFARNPHSLPRWETRREREIRADYFAAAGAGKVAAPPVAPVRNVAEFERMAGVLVRYPFGLGLPILKEMAADATLYCLVTTAEQNQARAAMESGGVNLAHVVFINQATDSYWTRDYTPWFVFDGNGKPGLIDFTYNRPRANDDAVAAKLGTTFNLPVYFMDLVHAGGNYMTDGHGISASTNLVYEENQTRGVSSQAVDQRIEDNLGVPDYQTVADPTGAYIKHIDTWAKFLAPDKIMIRRVPASHRQYAAIEAAVADFRRLASSYGKPYRIYRVDTPNDEPYANCLILNDKLFLAIAGGAGDAAALEAYRQAMPGYKVTGYTGTWESTDALHCRAFGITDAGLLHIAHVPLRDTMAAVAGGYAVEAAITPHGGKGLVPESLYVSYRTAAGSAFSTLRMNRVAGARYSALIPAPVSSTPYVYYIHAADSSGRGENHPFMGGADPHRFFATVGQVSIGPRAAAPALSKTHPLVDARGRKQTRRPIRSAVFSRP